MSQPVLYLKAVRPTAFFARKQSRLFQAVDLTVENRGKRTSASVRVTIGSQKKHITLSKVEPGKRTYRIYVPDVRRSTTAEFALKADGKLEDHRSLTWKPKRHWQIHLIHYSHHDLGYTDLPSNILAEHDGFYDEMLRLCERTDHFPDESRLRYTIEQSWSVIHFIENRPKAVVEKLVKYIKRGRIEVTALFGNEITELCGHEELIRLMYPSFRLKRKYKIPISSAELNDIPGLAWGLAMVLSGAGVKYFSPGIPLWYFDRTKLPSSPDGPTVHAFWDEGKVIPLDVPGAFRWEGPDGSEVLFWYDLHGGELYFWSYEQVLDELHDLLDLLEKRNYPLDIVSYTIRGAQRDNSPPSLQPSRIVREWNRKWAYPKLILSTNRRFFKHLEKHRSALPVFRGELPNTDYTIGAISSAKETGINRITHETLSAAEKFATVAARVSDCSCPAKTIEETYKNMLLHDEHTWGAPHTAGPAQDGIWAEKSTFVYKAAALSQDILLKSLNRIVDEVSLPEKGCHIAVFNSLSFERTDLVRTPFKADSPCGMTLFQTNERIVCGTAIGRNIINPPVEILEEGFELVDTQTKKRIPYQIVRLDDPLVPVPYAAERYALGQIDKSELFEIVFLAHNVPAMGYKTYRIVPSGRKKGSQTSISVSDTIIENRFFKIRLERKTGAITSIYDKQLDKELVDKKAAHRFGQLIARWSKTGSESVPEQAVVRRGQAGPVYGSILVSTKAPGCPQIAQEIIVYDRLKRIDFSNRILRDSTPLLEVYFAFPFFVENPQFRFEGSNSVIEPLKDQLPGSNTDYYTMQHWASVFNEELGIVFSSVEAPIIEFGGLWPGYVSAAHHCVTPPGYGHEFARERPDKGHLYSYVMNSNFCTNFKNTQVSDCLFRYSITTHRGDSRGPERDFGWAIGNPLVPVCINGEKKGSLPVSQSFCRIDQRNVLLLTLKEAEDGDGLIIRLLETEGRETTVKVRLPFLRIKNAYQTNLVEENEKRIRVRKDTIAVHIRPFGISTIRVRSEKLQPTEK